MKKQRILCMLVLLVLLVTGCGGKDPVVELAIQAWHKAGNYGRPIEAINIAHMEYSSKQKLGERCGDSYVDMVKGFSFLPEGGHIFLIQYYSDYTYAVVLDRNGRSTKVHDFSQAKDPSSLAEAESNLFFAMLPLLAVFSSQEEKSALDTFHFLTPKQLKAIE